MKDYKGLVENKETKERKIVYGAASTLPSFKTILRSKYKNHKIISASLNKSMVVMVYCNKCKTEVPNREMGAHNCG